MSTDAEWKTAWDITVAAMNKQAELIEEKDKKITELHAWADSMLRKIEVLEAQLAALTERHEKALIAGANMRLALADLMSWFPDKPTEPEWCLKAGVYGADEAIKAAQQILGDSEEKTDEQR